MFSASFSLNKLLLSISLVGIVSQANLNAQNPGIRLSYIDSTANPADDFYNFCNGKWQKTFVLPESDARYGSFNEINDNNLKRIKSILEAGASNKSAVPNTDPQRLRDFYNTAMDSAKADALGFTPIVAQLEQIDKITSIDDFLKLKVEFDFIGVNLYFATGVSTDLKNSKKHCFEVYQAGYGLGDRDYYYEDRFEEIRSNYKQYLAALFTGIGTEWKLAVQQANEVFDMEKALVNKALTRVEMRNPEKMYNVYNPAKLQGMGQKFKWEEFFKLKGIKQPDTVIVGSEEYIKELMWFLDRVTINDIKLYAKAQLLMEAAPYLSNKFIETHFVFRGVVMSGAKKMKPRWQRVHSVMDATMGDIVSKEYVKKYFTPDAKIKVNKLIDNLVLAYRDRINSRTWMSEATKKQANRKLDLLIRKIGYPDKWKDYTGLAVATDNYWANVCRANRFFVQDNLKDLKKPVDRQKWQMTAVTVNAYYNPTTNEITFPAAILQPPFFDPTAEDAANYGTMGAIIGHELTHGFDDQGSQFDADGNMKMWWTEEDFKKFKEKTQLIISQFNSYVAIDTLKVNGQMTQGENIADLGGLTMAYYAYKKSLAGKPSKVMNGFTGEQRFFMAWCQGWKGVTRDAELKRLLTIDYHSPSYFRAFAPLTNMKEFYEAFGVKPGNKLYVEENKRVEIW